MKTAAILLSAALALPAFAQVSEPDPEPLLIAAGSILLMKTATRIDTCKEDPCNSLIHVAAGAALGTYLKKKHGPWVAFWTVLAIGVGKEVLDNNFDIKDAAMTAAGGLLSVTVEF